MGVTKPIFSAPLFSQFSKRSKQWIPVWYQVHIWQVSPQLSRGDTWQLWTRLKVSDLYFAKSKFPVTEKITNGALVNPLLPPRPASMGVHVANNCFHTHLNMDGNHFSHQHEHSIYCNYGKRKLPFCIMMTSLNGNIFRVTGHLCGEFTGHRWIPSTKASDAELWCFLWSASD